MTIGPSLTAGSRVGGHEIVRLLRHGGMGSVFAARSLAMGEHVALKVMREVGGAAAERCAREGRLAERLSHPNIVAARGRGVSNGIAWIAMELLTGEDLHAVLARGPLSVAAADRTTQRPCARRVRCWSHASPTPTRPRRGGPRRCCACGSRWTIAEAEA